MPFRICSWLKTVLKTSSLVSGISSKFRFFASLYVISRMMWDKAEMVRESKRAECHCEGLMGNK